MTAWGVASSQCWVAHAILCLQRRTPKQDDTQRIGTRHLDLSQCRKLLAWPGLRRSEPPRRALTCLCWLAASAALAASLRAPEHKLASLLGSSAVSVKNHCRHPLTTTVVPSSSSFVAFNLPAPIDLTSAARAATPVADTCASMRSNQLVAPSTFLVPLPAFPMHTTSIRLSLPFLTPAGRPVHVRRHSPVFARGAPHTSFGPFCLRPVLCHG